MPTELTSPWTKRLTSANTRYNDWANKYKCNALEQYYRGFQWDVTKSSVGSMPYTLNMIYSTVKIKLANYLVRNPRVVIAPKPGDAAFNLEQAIASSQTKEAMINTIIQDQNSDFAFVLKKAARDSFFRFGMVEVGYSASFLENPNVDKPEYASDKNPDTEKNTVTTQPRETLESERIFFKYVNPKRFRLSAEGEADKLSSCSWCGYYEYVYIKDLANALGKKVDDLKSSLGANAAARDPEDMEDETLVDLDEQVKIWHIWDNRARKRLIITDADGEIRFSKDFERLPLFELRWDLDFEGFYPIPPTFQWISPQDEINEAREQARNHRRIFTRKFMMMENTISQEEIDKFTSGPDGTVISVKRMDAIAPIANPDLGKASDQALVIPKDDFNLVSSTSQEARGVGDRVTATQARIIEGRSNIREGAEVEEINSWMAYIIREAILIAQDRFTQPFYAETSQDAQSQMLMDYSMSRNYSQIYPDKLDDGYDFIVLIDVASTSPNQNEIEKQKFLEFISILQNFPQLSTSPLLIREAAYRVGYRNERVIREMQNAALLAMIGQAAQMGALPGNGGDPNSAAGGEGQRIVEQQTPQNDKAIEAQLQNQLVQ